MISAFSQINHQREKKTVDTIIYLFDSIMDYKTGYARTRGLRNNEYEKSIESNRDRFPSMVTLYANSLQ